MPVEEPEKLSLKQIHFFKMHASDVSHEVIPKEDVVVKLGSEESSCEYKPIGKGKFISSFKSESAVRRDALGWRSEL